MPGPLPQLRRARPDFIDGAVLAAAVWMVMKCVGWL